MSEENFTDFVAPYINLADVSMAPMHALALSHRANSNFGQATSPVPAQIVQPASFRSVLAAQVSPAVCPVDEPEALPAEMRTPAWQRMVATIQGEYGDTERVWAAELLFQLGFFDAYMKARAAWPRPEDSRWADFFDVLDWFARRRVHQGDDQLRASLLAMARDAEVWPAARLFAAAALIVGAATGRCADVDFIGTVFADTEPTALAMEQAGPDRPGSLFLSTYWRGAAFVPYLAGDTAQTMEWLDRSLAFADQAAGGDEAGPVEAMTKYPVLETRARVLRSAGRPEDALHELRTLSALDPFDARVFLKLGDTYSEIGRLDDADACYTRATRLGPPLAPLAHLTLARLCRRMGNAERAALHLDTAKKLDPALRRSKASPVRAAARREVELPAPSVSPDPRVAIEIQAATAAQRDRMLGHLHARLSQVAGPAGTEELAAATDQIRALPEPQRRRLLCGPSFSIWLADAIRIIGNPDPAGLAACQAASPTVLADPMMPDLADRALPSIPVVGGGNHLLASFIERINAADLARGGRGDVVISQAPEHIALVRELLALIERSWPELDREIREVIGTVVPFRSGTKTAITNASMHGTLLIRVPFEDDAIALDRFVHEAAHVLLNLALEVRPCHAGPPGATMPSPFRGGPRPIEGVLHGVFVFTRAAAAVARAQGALTSPASAVRRMQRSLTIISSGLLMLDEYGNLNEYGQEIASNVRTTARSLISDFGIAQF
jgi:HEXXH motif-containing protein